MPKMCKNSTKLFQIKERVSQDFRKFFFFFPKRKGESVNVLQMVVKSLPLSSPLLWSSNTLSCNMLILSFVFVLPLIGLPVFLYFFFYKTHCRRHKTAEHHNVPLTDALGIAVNFFHILANLIFSNSPFFILQFNFFSTSVVFASIC